MTVFSITDHECMARALQLAAQGITSTHPNPRVGCVLWRDGKVVGEGWHRAAGDAHAEINALADAGDSAQGATAYVTLEPCAHHGRTGPCSSALIEAGVSRVVAAMQDPFTAVGGQGFAALRAAAVQVEVGLMAAAARSLNAGFLSRIERGTPFVRLKSATSLDGATAMLSGASQWITSEPARADVQRWRARSDAILTGSGTVIADDPALTFRDGRLGRAAPLRVIVDSTLQTPPTSQLVTDGISTLLCCTNDAKRALLERDAVEVVKLGYGQGGVSLAEVLTELASRQINEVLVEAGPRLAGAFIEQGLVDELVIYQAPHIMGSETARLAATPAWQRLQDRLQLEVIDRRLVGPDLRIIARPAKRSSQ
ncbi:MAG: bifunctional diaminohydroxyphosphoribosylaminopyrimidine deaminase/5-amino-6-(5-phosphoribosylamino)uracil reductase RibD [Woeseia sp.]